MYVSTFFWANSSDISFTSNPWWNEICSISRNLITFHVNNPGEYCFWCQSQVLVTIQIFWKSGLGIKQIQMSWPFYHLLLAGFQLAFSNTYVIHNIGSSNHQPLMISIRGSLFFSVRTYVYTLESSVLSSWLLMY